MTWMKRLVSSRLCLTLIVLDNDSAHYRFVAWATGNDCTWGGQSVFICAGQFAWTLKVLAAAHAAEVADTCIGLADVASSSGYWFADRTHCRMAFDQGPEHVMRWLHPVADQLLRNTFGKESNLPNIVFFPSEERFLNVGSYAPKPETGAFEWLYTCLLYTSPSPRDS